MKPLSHYTYAQIQALRPWVEDADLTYRRWRQFSDFLGILSRGVEERVLTPEQARVVLLAYPAPTKNGRITLDRSIE